MVVPLPFLRSVEARHLLPAHTGSERKRVCATKSFFGDLLPAHVRVSHPGRTAGWNPWSKPLMVVPLPFLGSVEARHLLPAHTGTERTSASVSRSCIGDLLPAHVRVSHPGRKAGWNPWSKP